MVESHRLGLVRSGEYYATKVIVLDAMSSWRTDRTKLPSCFGVAPCATDYSRSDVDSKYLPFRNNL
ncbi:hypothetical protein J5A52_02145 [TM7 phylum sp. oral taxon 349]|nr:hypothetical protein J5A52_02145 [TM7 phylum sp. oral taxon 349]